MSGPYWAWWVVRDDGDRCAGPFDTKDEAEHIWRNVFDISEYCVDYQYAVLDAAPPEESESMDLLRARLAEALLRLDGQSDVQTHSEETS